MLSYRRFSLTWLSIPPQKKRFCSRSVDYPRRSLHCSRGGLARCFCTLTSGFTIISTNVNPKTANFERTNSTQKTQQNYVYINTILQSKTERFESGLFALFFFFSRLAAKCTHSTRRGVLPLLGLLSISSRYWRSLFTRNPALHTLWYLGVSNLSKRRLSV